MGSHLIDCKRIPRVIITGDVSHKFASIELCRRIYLASFPGTIHIVWFTLWVSETVSGTLSGDVYAIPDHDYEAFQFLAFKHTFLIFSPCVT